MAVIKFHNTLSGRKEVFEPITAREVRMYNCGPTVYNYVHLGNLRSGVFSDVLRRTLEYNNFQVTQVMNITDIGHLRSDADEGEDKMTGALRREGKPLSLESLKDLADFYTSSFLVDLNKLNIERPTIMPKASENIAEDLALIARLEQKGFVYSTSDGVYFDTSKDPQYGKLGGLNLKETESRVGQNPQKRQGADFALWKFNSELGWESPYGKGFPGWHIECSAMSMKYLGETFDIHTGGIEHIPIHHNNEIAQSESASGQSLANYWLHHGHITIDGQKISKSLGNDVYLKDLEVKNISPLAYRYWLLTSHYNTAANFTYEAVNGSQAALTRLSSHLSSSLSGKISEEYRQKFLAFINDDLDTPKALALVWDLLKDPQISEDDKRATILDFDRVFGLDLEKGNLPEAFQIPAEIRRLAEDRQLARLNKDWQKSDQLRQQIQENGFGIRDTEDGYKITK